MGKPKNAKETATFYTSSKSEKALLAFAERYGIGSKSAAQAKIVRDRFVKERLLTRDQADGQIQ